MNEEVSATKPDTEAALYVGAITTAIVYLLPYVTDFIITPYVVGAMVAVYYAVKKRGQILALKEGAKLGFLSTFFGGIASAIIFDIIWQFFDFQLWQKQNSEFMVTIFSAFASPALIDTMKISMAQNATKPFSWYIIIFQLIGGLIFSGIFGSLFGLLGVKMFQRPRATVITI